MIAVIDTDVIVSGLWSRGVNPFRVVSEVINGDIQVCYDYRVLERYESILKRAKFGFRESDVDAFVLWIRQKGLSIVPTPIPDSKLEAGGNLAFYELAKHCNCPLITGDTGEYPEDPLVVDVKDFGI